MPGYLTVNIDHVRRAWDQALALPERPEPELTVEQRSAFGRRAVLVHAPLAWPLGIFCRNCHAPYPCRNAILGMWLLSDQGWDFPAVVDLIEASEPGEPA